MNTGGTTADAFATGMIVGVVLCLLVVYRSEIARAARITSDELGITSLLVKMRLINKGVDDDD